MVVQLPKESQLLGPPETSRANCRTVLPGLSNQCPYDAPVDVGTEGGVPSTPMGHGGDVHRLLQEGSGSEQPMTTTSGSSRAVV